MTMDSYLTDEERQWKQSVANCNCNTCGWTRTLLSKVAQQAEEIEGLRRERDKAVFLNSLMPMDKNALAQRAEAAELRVVELEKALRRIIDAGRTPPNGKEDWENRWWKNAKQARELAETALNGGSHGK